MALADAATDEAAGCALADAALAEAAGFALADAALEEAAGLALAEGAVEAAGLVPAAAEVAGAALDGAALEGPGAAPVELQPAKIRTSAPGSRMRFTVVPTNTDSPAAGRPGAQNSTNHSAVRSLALRIMPVADESYVRLDKADFQFCAAHFCVFPGEREPLHGHNYRVYVELGGPVDALGYVAEFGWLKKIIRELVASLDHRVLIATRCPELEVAVAGGQVAVHWRGDSWSLPEGDVVQLPIENTTAELLAGWLWQAVRDRLGAQEGWTRLSVEVEETPGQRAGVVRALGAS